MICFHCKEPLEDWQIYYHIGDGEVVHFDCQKAGFITPEVKAMPTRNEVISDKHGELLVKQVGTTRQFEQECSDTNGDDDEERDAAIRTFESGATRDTDENKLDFEGFLSPLVLQAYAEYMNENRVQSDGNIRASDNWQRGIPKDAYMKSGWRHFFDWWSAHRGYPSREGMIKALCGLLFNVQGYLHELLKENK